MSDAQALQRFKELGLIRGCQVGNSQLATLVTTAGIDLALLGQEKRVVPGQHRGKEGKDNRLVGWEMKRNELAVAAAFAERGRETHVPAATATIFSRCKAMIFRGTMHV
jgi:hypothetical protein